MDYNTILQIAEIKLGIEFNHIIEDLKYHISAGCTGGEIDSMVGKYLKDLQINDINAYSILKDDINMYLIELRRRGLIII